jgi:hypothetical protein
MKRILSTEIPNSHGKKLLERIEEKLNKSGYKIKMTDLIDVEVWKFDVPFLNVFQINEPQTLQKMYGSTTKVAVITSTDKQPNEYRKIDTHQKLVNDINF